jgi:diguanylate cyclase
MTFLPLADLLASRERRALHVVAALLVVTIAAATVHGLFGIGGPGLDAPVRDWVSSLVYVLVAAIVALRALRVPEQRGPWIILAVGISLYGAGNLLWALWLEHVAEPPIPSVSDLLWLSLYPASYIGLVWLARTKGRHASAGVWLDGIVAGFGVAAIGAAVVFHQVLQAASGNAAAVVTNLAYPVGDLLLAALVMGVLALRGWRLDRTWALLGGGFLVLTLADSVYLLQVASGTSASSLVANVFYVVGVGLLAFAAWQPSARNEAPRLEGWSILLAPAIFTLAALFLLTYDHFVRLDALALVLALGTLMAALVRMALSFRDLRTLAETRRQAMTDDLTSLPNRRHFMRRLDDAIEAARVRDGSVALLIADLDNFKELNDTLGHHAGDVLLQQIGPRLTGAVRATDSVARLGGDEFALVLEVPSDERAAVRVGGKVLEAITRPFDVHGLSLHVGASVGISLFPEHGDDAEELLQRADVAMYQAKAAQTGTEVYARERDTHSRGRLELVGELRGALESEAIMAHFQPKVEAVGRRVVGVEALVRWEHPVHGMLAPAAFVPLAEQAGLSRTLTRRMLELALVQCAAWRATVSDLHVAVNMTAADLLDAGLPGEVDEALARFDLPPEALMIEITESSVLSNPAQIGDVLAQLHGAGVGLSLDDFGTGYSSLAHLRTLPVGEVKIDRSFIATMGSDEKDAAIVRATIQLAHSLGMEIVAEGVEEEATWERLAALGCELVQGFAFSKPLPADELEPLLRASAVRQARDGSIA